MKTSNNVLLGGGVELITQLSNCFSVNVVLRILSEIEYPTVVLAAAVYTSWILLTYFHSCFPAHVLFVLGGIVITVQSSLQHETIHGHPTRLRILNKLIGYPPLSLWLPFEIYQASHLQHHKNESLTDPFDDPESGYITQQKWEDRSKLARMISLINATVFGRLLLGPCLVIGRFWHAELTALIEGDLSHLKFWFPHTLSVILITSWLVFCKMDMAQYFLLFVLPGTTLLSLRSFAEHKAELSPSRRTAIVENASVLGLLFLNNNLHAVHHRYSFLAWYHLPRVYRLSRNEFVSRDNHLIYNGYGDIIRRFLFKKHDVLVHPFAASNAKHFMAQEQKVLLHMRHKAAPDI